MISVSLWRELTKDPRSPRADLVEATLYVEEQLVYIYSRIIYMMGDVLENIPEVILITIITNYLDLTEF